MLLNIFRRSNGFNSQIRLTKCFATTGVFSMKLRDYQQDAIDAVIQSVNRGIRRPSVVLATGGGKTVVFSHLVPLLKPTSPERGNKTLVLAHKEELVTQAAKVLANVNPDLKVSIDMRTSKYDPTANIIVASIPTLVRMTRLNIYNPNEFKTIILDECHHATAKSWVKILDYFGANSPELPIYVIGFTATMERSDGQSLGKSFDEITYKRTLLEMVQNKELVDIKFSTVNLDLNLSQIKIKFDDYDTLALSKALNRTDANAKIVMTYSELKQKHNFKSTIVFCVDIEHCRSLCETFRQYGINAQYVTGFTVKYERRSIIQDFKDGKIDVLCNVQVFTEGTDIPNIDSLFLARPTKSRSLLVQMIGRGLRLHEGKEYCHVVDIADTKSVGIQSVPNLFDLPGSYIIKDKSFTDISTEKELLDQQEKLKKNLAKFELEQEIGTSLESIKKSFENGIFNIKTIEGFEALETSITEKFKDAKFVKQTFYKSKIIWIKLKHNCWGFPYGKDSFCLVEYIAGNYIMKYCNFYNKVEPKFSFKSLNYYITKKNEPTGDLGSIINEAEGLENRVKYSTLSYMSKNKGITNNQVEYLSSKLRATVKTMYGIERYDELKDKLSGISLSRASLLIFAAKFSVKSLWVRWEMMNLLGPDKQVKRAISQLNIEDLED